MQRKDYRQIDKKEKILLGDPNKVGIQFQIVEEIDGYVYGHMCFIINNKYVGNFSEISTLTICKNYMISFLQNKPKRCLVDSEQITSKKLFKEVYEIFQTRYWERVDFLKISEFRDVFWLDEVAEYSFRDRIGMILIDECHASRQRIIWKEFESGEIYEQTIPSDFFDKLGREFISFFEDR